MTNREKSLHTRKVLITGASSGIGRAFSHFLAERGCHIILTARREKRLENIKKEIQASGGTCTIIPSDLSKESSRTFLYHQITDSVGDIDVLINNAGFGWYGYYRHMDWLLARRMVDVNMLSAMHLTRLFLPRMLERKQGHVINISSIAGALPNQGIAVYSGTKAFLDAFSTALYREYHRTGVAISTMRLGPVKTEFFDQALRKPNGRSVPSQRFSISTDRVNRALWRLLQHPRRAVYVPGWLALTKHVENIFGPVIDLLGPLLLKQRND